MRKARAAGSVEAKALQRHRSCKRRAVVFPPVGVLVVSLALSALPGWEDALPSAAAQDSWVFAESIPCNTAPVYGMPFNNCTVSNTRRFRVGDARAWRLLFRDATSEAAVGLYRLIEARGGHR